MIDLHQHPVQPIFSFESANAWSAEVAAGGGEARIHVVRMEAGGIIGPHEAQFGQLFLVVSGRGWLQGRNGRVELAAGQGAFVSRGENHSKGATSELTALIVQVFDLTAKEPPG